MFIILVGVISGDSSSYSYHTTVIDSMNIESYRVFFFIIYHHALINNIQAVFFILIIVIIHHHGLMHHVHHDPKIHFYRRHDVMMVNVRGNPWLS